MKSNLFFSFVISLMIFNNTPAFAQNFQTSDLEGTWYMFDTTVDPTAIPPAPPVFWTYGEFNSDASGNIVSGAYYAPDPMIPPFTVSSGQMMIDNKGVMSGTATVNVGPGITATAVFPHGKMDQAKTNGALVSLMTIDGTSNTSMGVGTFIKGGGTFSQADLEGEWHGQGTMIHLTQGVFPVSGIFNIDQNGNVSGSYTAPTGITATVVGGSNLVMDGDGLVSGTVNLSITLPGGGAPIPVVSLVAHGKMDQNKKNASFVTSDFDPSMTTLLSLTNVNVVKGGGTFTGTDLSGAWYTYSLGTDYSDPDPNNWLIYWLRGEYQTDSSGNISNGFYVGPDGTVINATGGMISLNNAGGISGNITIEGGDTVTVSGKLDQGKTYGIFGSVDDAGVMSGMTTGVMIKNTYSFPWPMFMPSFTGDHQQ